MSDKLISLSELESKKSADAYWVAVEGNVYDVTEFVDEHPGGAKILKNSCGKDSTSQFNKFHNGNVLKKYAKLKIGKLQEKAKL